MDEKKNADDPAGNAGNKKESTLMKCVLWLLEQYENAKRGVDDECE